MTHRVSRSASESSLAAPLSLREAALQVVLLLLGSVMLGKKKCISFCSIVEFETSVLREHSPVPLGFVSCQNLQVAPPYIVFSISKPGYPLCLWN